jgi:hypothetical protein
MRVDLVLYVMLRELIMERGFEHNSASAGGSGGADVGPMASAGSLENLK